MAWFRRKKPPTPVVTVTILDEINQNPEWWEREYRKLERKNIPRDAAYHEGHRKVEMSIYMDMKDVRKVECVDCGVQVKEG